MSMFQFMTENPFLTFAIAVIISVTIEVTFKCIVAIVTNKKGGAE